MFKKLIPVALLCLANNIVAVGLDNNYIVG